MRRGRLAATGLMLVFCLFAIWQSLLLSLTDRLGPGPGFFPFWLGLIGALLAVALLIATFRFPGTVTFWPGPWPWTSAEGDSTRSISAGSG